MQDIPKFYQYTMSKCKLMKYLIVHALSSSFLSVIPVWFCQQSENFKITSVQLLKLLKCVLGKLLTGVSISLLPLLLVGFAECPEWNENAYYFDVKRFRIATCT